MFHRIVVDIIHVRAPIPFIANGVFPEAPLPDRTLSTTIGLGGDTAGKGLFYFTPAAGIVLVGIRQTPDTVKMVGQNDNGIDRERLAALHLAESISEQFDTRLGRKNWYAVFL